MSILHNRVKGGLREYNAFGAVAAVGGLAGHGGVSATGAEEQFSVGLGFHQFELLIFDAIRAANGGGTIDLDSFHFDDEGITFFMDGKAVVVGNGRIGSEGFGTDHAGGDFGVHRDRHAIR